MKSSPMKELVVGQVKNNGKHLIKNMLDSLMGAKGREGKGREVAVVVVI